MIEGENTSRIPFQTNTMLIAFTKSIMLIPPTKIYLPPELPQNAQFNFPHHHTMFEFSDGNYLRDLSHTGKCLGH